MKMYILAATPGFIEAQLVSLGGLLPCSLLNVLRIKRGPLTQGPLLQLSIRITWGQ